MAYKHFTEFGGFTDESESELFPIELTYEQLFKLFNADKEVKDHTGDITLIPKGIYVQTPDDFVEIDGLVKKGKTRVLKILIEDCGEMRVAEEHLFADKFGNSVKAIDAESVMTVNGLKSVLSKEFFIEDDVYDIAIPAPHWYLAPNGVINHNSMIGLAILREAQRRGMECVVIDTERSFDFSLAASFGIETDKLPVVQTGEIAKIKQLISELSNGKNRAERENTFVLFDSWGRLVSQVNLDKAAEGSTARDMSLPFWKNELANLMAETDMTFFVINHIYANTGGFGDPLSVPGGKRLYFNSDGIVMCMGGAKDKDGDDITGKIVIAAAKKGRKAIEFSKLKYRLNHDGGLDMFYGLLDDALEHGCVFKPRNGRFARTHIADDKPLAEKEIYNADFWIPIFKNTDFETYLSKKYSFVGREMDNKDQSINDLMS